MGATLPTLTRYLTRDATLTGAFSRLYAANTIGAIVGTTLAGFVLIELFGLSGALAVGAGCSATAGLAALWLGRSGRGSMEPVVIAPAGPVSARIVAPVRAPADDTRRGLVRADPRLALGVAFISGLTSLGYQVTWTRLLASGTGNTTYVFTTILATFLVGIALGAVLFAALRTRLGDPMRLLAASQVVAAVLALLGLVFVLVAPHVPTPGQPIETLQALFRTSIFVVLPVTIALGIAFPASSALLTDDASHAGEGSGGLLATNTIGAILGSLVVPFVLIPLLGSPLLVAVLALVNATLGIALGWGRVARPAGRWIAATGVVVAAVIVVTALRPGILVQPNEAYIASVGGRLFDSSEDEIASVQAGQIHSTPELWVTGTSMTLLTVDAKLMPVLPLIARPDVDQGAGRRIRDGIGLPRCAHRRPSDGCRRAGAERAEDVRRLLRRCGQRPGEPERPCHHHRRPQPSRADGPDATTSSSPTPRPRSRAPARRSSRRRSTTRPAATT